MQMDSSIGSIGNGNGNKFGMPYVCLMTQQFGHLNPGSSGSSVAADSEDSTVSTASYGGLANDASDGLVRARHKQMPRQKINARERCRTFNVNAAYEALRGLIPTEPVNRKLSKIEIIRLASSYITHLRSSLLMESDCSPCLLQRDKLECGGSLARVSICTFCRKSK